MITYYKILNILNHKDLKPLKLGKIKFYDSEYDGESLMKLNKTIRNSIEITENDQKIEFTHESIEFFNYFKNRISNILYNDNPIQFKLNKVNFNKKIFIFKIK
jgi:hypothetical protein